MPARAPDKFVWAVFLLVLSLSATASAQSEARFGLDSAISADLFRGQNTVERPNIIVDITAVAHLGQGWMVYIRPWFRQPRTTEWDKEIYQAALQYTRPGRVATRFDLGYVASPVGLGMLDTRPGVNPTIGPHYSYFSTMPSFDPGAPRVPAISGTYPLGGVFTASTNRWDARAALVSSAPTRSYEIGNETNPPSSPAIEFGAGITPSVGLRFGGSFAHADYAKASELTSPGPDRALTMVTLEGEYAFAHTKLAGEVTRDHFTKATGSDHAYAWFVQGTQTLTPRVFVAARQEGVMAPLMASGSLAGTRPLMHVTEATIGYKLSTEFTVRTSFLGRKAFTRTAWDQQVAMSLVWTRRWW